ncbi:hypothetical protein MKW92_016888 [Papaver armeniacum]|nr:hypothetical protein MKW92_016888 [Papaver armeniacum]
METSNKAPASPSSTSSNLIVFARLSGLLVAVLVLVWGSSLSCNGDIGFVIISGEEIGTSNYARSCFGIWHFRNLGKLSFGKGGFIKFP